MNKSDKLKYKIIVLLVIFIFIFFIYSLKGVLGGPFTSDTITTTISEEESDKVFNSVEKTFEISPNVLSKDYLIDVPEQSALSFMILDNKYTIVLWKIENDKVTIVFFGGKTSEIKIGESKVYDLNSDTKFDIIVTLNSISDGIAYIAIKSYSEKSDFSVDYKELFDIDIGLSDDKVSDSSDLTMYIKFINFGEGPSRINIVYSIKDSNGSEVYRGVDDKVVYTEESLIKNFNFLKLEKRKYLISAQIFYGQNQTAFSEKAFEVTGKYDSNSFFKAIGLLILIFIGLFSLIFYLRKTSPNKS